MNPLAQIPAKARYYVYLGYSLALVVWGAISIMYTDPDPEFVNKGGDVLQYLGGALALTAASNVKSDDGPPPPLENNPLRPGEDDDGYDPKHAR